MCTYMYVRGNVLVVCVCMDVCMTKADTDTDFLCVKIKFEIGAMAYFVMLLIMMGER